MLLFEEAMGKYTLIRMSFQMNSKEIYTNC